MLEKISKLLKIEDLFDECRFEYIQGIIELEIKNLISKDEMEKIMGEIDMSPQAERIFSQAIDEVHRKSVHEARLDGIEEGLEKGIEKGIDKGKNDAMEEMARNLKDVMDDEEISRRTGLSVEKVRELN